MGGDQDCEIVATCRDVELSQIAQRVSHADSDAGEPGQVRTGGLRLEILTEPKEQFWSASFGCGRARSAATCETCAARLGASRPPCQRRKHARSARGCEPPEGAREMASGLWLSVDCKGQQPARAHGSVGSRSTGSREHPAPIVLNKKCGLPPASPERRKVSARTLLALAAERGMKGPLTTCSAPPP